MTTTLLTNRTRSVAHLVLAAIVQSSLWVSAAVTTLLFYAGHILGLAVPPAVYVLGFASAMVVMNFDHLVDARFEAIAGSPAQRTSTVAILTVSASALLLFAMTLVNTPVRIVCVCYGLIGVFYGLPFFPIVWRRPVVWRRLKDIPGIKGWLVSGAIVFATVALPLAASGRAFAPRTVIMLAATLYLFIGSNAHMVDIRDIDHDRSVGNITLPTLIGARKTRRLLLSANVVALFLIAAAQFTGIVPLHPEIEIGMIVTMSYILFLPTENASFLYPLLIDGCIFVLPIAGRLHDILGGAARP
ncbi:MAG TPA: hypothetical protein VF713_16495 [Thermoanaerobaculia bacterium]